MTDPAARGHGPVASVAVDQFWLEDGGIGRMAQEIIARADPAIAIEGVRCSDGKLSKLAPLTLARDMAKAKSDIVWSPGFIPPARRFPGKKVAITIHDLGHIELYSPAHTIYYNLIIRPLLRNVDLVFTVSEYSRQQILQWVPSYPADKVISIYNGVSDSFHLDGPVESPGYPYIIYVGNRRAHKNLERAIRAFGQSGLAAQGFRFLFTGDPDADIERWMGEAGARDNLVFLGKVPDERLAALYRGARALIFVSLYEGFGLPLVEAMACGCPSVTSNTTALAEIGGEAAVRVDPESVADIASGMKRLCLDDGLRDELRAISLERAKLFRWDDAAAAYWKHLLA